MRRRTAIASLAALALIAVAAPGPASAGTMYRYGSYDGDAGVNAVTASFDGTWTTLSDPAGITLTEDATYPGEGDCVFISATSVRCAYAHGYSLSLDGSNDSFTYIGAAPPGGSSTEFFRIDGGAGADVLNGSPYKDRLTGDGLSVNSDLVNDPAGNDQLFGNGGDDDLHDNDGSSNRIEGGAGVDRTYIGEGKAANTILGGPGDDWLLGGGGNETIDGEDGADNINGGDGDDQVRGGPGKDDVEGGGDDDVTDGGAGDDAVSASFHGGGCHTDTLIGGAGRDDLYAACGVPTLKLRDGTKDEARCLPKVTTATVDRDKIDEVTGGACERKSKGCKKKAKKRSTATAAGKKKKCRKKASKRK